MTVFKSFFLILNQRKIPLMIYIPVFLGLCIAFSKTGDTADGSFTPTNTHYAVVDEDQSTLSQGLIDYLKQNNTVTLYDAYDSTLGDQLYYSLLDYVLVIPHGFGEAVLSGANIDDLLSGYAVPGSTAEQYSANQITQFLNTYRAYQQLDMPSEKIMEKTVETLTKACDIVISNDQGEVIKPDEDYYFFQYLPYLFLCMMIQLLTAILVIYRKEDVARRMDCAEISVMKRNLCLFLATLLTSAVLFVLFFSFKFVLFSTELHPYRLINTILFFGISVSLAYCLSVFNPGDSIISLVSNVVGLGLAFISGAFVPTEFLPNGILTLAKCFPMYWNLQINAWAVEGSMTLEPKVLFCFSFQFLYIVLFLAIALFVSKRCQQR